MLRTSESLKSIAAALLVAQRLIDTVSKEAENPYFDSRYADLEAVMGAIKKPLNDVGIVILQFPDSAPEGQLALTTRLQHESGEFYEATATVPLSKNDPQAFGSAMTYTRRYGLQAIIGLITADDDGNAASDPRPRQPAKTDKKPPTRLGEPSKAPAGKLGAKPEQQETKPPPGKLGGFKKPAAATPPVKGKAKLFPVADSGETNNDQGDNTEPEFKEDDIPF